MNLYNDVITAVFSKLLMGILLACTLLWPATMQAKPNLNLPVQTLEGKTQRLSSMIGNKPVYLKFWASWCKTCVQQMPHFQKIQDTIGNQVDIISINIDINETDPKINQMIKRFGLTMPTVKDAEGKLAKNLKFVGTPYHVLINTSGEVVHSGHLVTDKLDNKLRILASDPMSNMPQVELLDIKGQALTLNTTDIDNTVLFFTATWCESYLKDTRPAMSKACVQGQQDFNQLAQQFPNVKFQVITSHLWTEPKELQEYITKHAVKASSAIDTTGDLFFAYGIKHFPTAVLLKGQNVVVTTQDISSIPTHLSL